MCLPTFKTVLCEKTLILYAREGNLIRYAFAHVFCAILSLHLTRYFREVISHKKGLLSSAIVIPIGRYQCTYLGSYFCTYM